MDNVRTSPSRKWKETESNIIWYKKGLPEWNPVAQIIGSNQFQQKRHLLRLLRETNYMF